MLRCRLVDDGAALRDFGEAWDGLALRSEFPNVFATSGFARAWWRAFGRLRKLRLAVVEDSSGLRLIAPFSSDDSEPGVWRMIGDPRADYMNLIFAAGDVESLACLTDWLNGRPDWEAIVLRRLPRRAAALGQFPRALELDSGLRERLIGFGAVRFNLAFARSHDEHPWMDRTALGRLAGLLDQSKYRHAIRQLSQRGTLRFETLRNRPAICERLGEFMDQHVALWASKGDRSQFLEPESREFFAFLTEELSPSDAVRLDTMTLDGRLVAAHYGFTFEGRLHYYKPCYDIGVPSHPGPGKLLLAYIIRQAGAEGLCELDLGQGKEPYKADYASDSRATSSVLIRRSRLKTAFEWMRGGTPCRRCGKRISCPHIARQ